MARFNRQRLIDQLSDVADRQQKFFDFTDRTGTAQLRPARCSKDLDSLIDRAVAYGRWRQMQDLVADLQNGTAGT